jgi:hypothetical protein
MKKFIIPPAVKVELVPLKAPGGTPDKTRQAKSKQALLGAGGKRVSVNLTGQAVADLEAIKARDGVDSTNAIIGALRQAAP